MTHQIKSYAKINLALNIVGKNSVLHKIESIIAFIELHDIIQIRLTNSKKHNVSFYGKFSKNISSNNTVAKLLKILDKRKLLKNKKFKITIKKQIPSKAGLGGGSMNSASILRFLAKKKIIKVTKKELLKIAKLVGSDVILGLNPISSILTSKNKLKYFNKSEKFHILVIKPNFGCSTKDMYSRVRKYNKPKISHANKNMFKLENLKKMGNSLEHIALTKYPRLKKLKVYLENLSPEFVRLTGSGSALVAYFQSKVSCEIARKQFNKKYKNYWCMASKTI